MFYYFYYQNDREREMIGETPVKRRNYIILI